MAEALGQSLDWTDQNKPFKWLFEMLSVFLCFSTLTLWKYNDDTAALLLVSIAIHTL